MTGEKQSDEHVPGYIAKEVLEYAFVMGPAKDVAARVLRLHALTEYYLDRLISIFMKNGGLISSDERFSYYHKIQIVNALGILNPAMIGCLRKLSGLRNRLAHVPWSEVSMEEIDRIGKLLGGKYEIALQENSGDKKELAALSWAIFEDLSIKVAPLEALLDEGEKELGSES